jgi:hypothetical protein
LFGVAAEGALQWVPQHCHEPRARQHFAHRRGAARAGQVRGAPLARYFTEGATALLGRHARERR